MPTPNPHTDLLLESVQLTVPHRLIDAPRVETSREGNGRFDWKPTVLLVALGAAAVVAFAYL